MPGAAQLPSPGTEKEFMAAGHRPISGDKIMQMFVGNTTYVVLLLPWAGAPEGSNIPVYWRNRKRAVIGLSHGKGTADATWWIDSNRVCMKYRINTDFVGCDTLYDVGDYVYSCRHPVGDCDRLFRTVPGNPEGL
jgi:hypothetical protein